MSDSESESPKKTSSISSEKSAKERDVPKPAAKAHPPTSTMVAAAIKNLNEKKGSSINAIKKYIAATYNVDSEKLAIYIKKYVKNAVISGELVQTSGKGASGSFRFPTKSDKAKKKAAELESSDKEEAPAKSKREGIVNTKKEAPAKPKKEASAKSKEKVASKSKKEKSDNEELTSPKKNKVETKKGSKSSKSTTSKVEKTKKSEKSPTKLKPPKAKKADKLSPKKAATKAKA